MQTSLTTAVDLFSLILILTLYVNGIHQFFPHLGEVSTKEQGHRFQGSLLLPEAFLSVRLYVRLILPTISAETIGTGCFGVFLII